MVMRLESIVFGFILVAFVLGPAGCTQKPNPLTEPADGANRVPQPEPPAPVIVVEWPYEEPPEAPQGAELQKRLVQVSFEPGSTALDGEARGALGLKIEEIEVNPRWHLVVVGHADALEGRPDAMSAGRAETVARYLRSRGILLERMSTMSVGSRYAKADKYQPTERGFDRSAEVWVFIQ
jgi:outer membrane protein OmpA-like peptidoglycan-associated protein